MFPLLKSKIRPRVSRLRNLLGWRSIVFDSRIGLNDTVILASMGRSGSTFVSEVINCENIYRVLFEPFRFDRVREAKDFVYPLYLSPDNTDPRFFFPAQKILSGKVHSQWIDKENRAIFPQKRLIKDIRINLILKWLHNRFPKVKIVLLVRHPCAVAESWISIRSTMGLPTLDALCTNDRFVENLGKSVLDEYRNAEPGFESLIFFWCVYHWVPFQQFNKDELYLLFYEDLLMNQKAELESLFSFLGHTYSLHKAFRVFSRPSSTTRFDSDIFKEEEFKFDSWLKHITSRQLDRAFEIMELFGLENVYSPATAKPNREIALNLFR